MAKYICFHWVLTGSMFGLVHAHSYRLVILYLTNVFFIFMVLLFYSLAEKEISSLKKVRA